LTGRVGNDSVRLVKTKKPTFDDLCKLEPELRELLEQAKKLGEKKNAYELFHYRIKPNLTTLVGEHAKHPQLQSFEAYGVVVDKIMKALDL
jgi:hypothetical protein